MEGKDEKGEEEDWKELNWGRCEEVWMERGREVIQIKNAPSIEKMAPFIRKAHSQKREGKGCNGKSTRSQTFL